jgi:excisionase family DNA binding protein
MKTILNEIYYDVSEVARLLGLAPGTIRQYFRNKHIEGKKIGKSWFAHENAIKDYVNGENKNGKENVENDRVS